MKRGPDPAVLLLVEVAASLLESYAKDHPASKAAALAASLRLHPNARNLFGVASSREMREASGDFASTDIRSAASYAHAHIRERNVKDVAVRHGLILRDSFRALGDDEHADRVHAMIEAIPSVAGNKMEMS